LGFDIGEYLGVDVFFGEQFEEYGVWFAVVDYGCLRYFFGDCVVVGLYLWDYVVVQFGYQLGEVFWVDFLDDVVVVGLVLVEFFDVGEYY